MQGRSLLCSLMVAGCSGVQGGSEGDGSGRCTYDSVAIADADAVPQGFDRSPRELFSVILSPEVGRLSNGRAVSLTFEPDYADLFGLYANNGATDCGPHLATSAHASLLIEGSLEGAAQGSIVAGLEIRWGKPLASARFEAAPGTPLVGVVPTFSRAPVTAPMLDVWLRDFGPQGVESEWRWSAFVGCGSGEQCSGGPSPSGGATSGIEVSWGVARLAAQ